MSIAAQSNTESRYNRRFVQVALRVALDRVFDYALPPEASATVGSVVRVSLRGKPVRGVVTALLAQPSVDPKRLKVVDAVEKPLAADQMALCDFVHRYYRAPIGMCYALALSPEVVAERTARSAFAGPVVTANPITLNAEQRIASAAIAAAHGQHSCFVLHGITGSGKTEVYLDAIRQVIARGEQALVLVPEINLTPQWLARSAAQLPMAQLAVLHSGLADGERYRAWQAAARGEANVVFGTRLAVFAPLPKLALIVVDEEHDASFKQQDTPRYHARDLAVLRARNRGIPIVLGSATPSLETYANAQRGRYQWLALTQRAHASALPPRIALVSARDSKKSEGLSPALLAALDDRLARGEQSLVYINRRGFAPILHCGLCGWQARCTDCDASMVFHSFDQKLRCHHCGAQSKVPNACPSCGNLDIVPAGAGTQRIEAFLRKRYPHARIARADADSTRGKHDWAALYAQMAAGEIDILVGTQMIAKGHDFSRLTLVGVVGADDALYSADFRAPERLFAQMMQVSGRAGRAALAGEVLIQTDAPEHPIYAAVVAQDYAAFAAREWAERESGGMPPAQALALIRAESSDSAAAQRALKQLHNTLTRGQQSSPLEIFPPVPSPLARRATKYRWHMMLLAPERAALREALNRCAAVDAPSEVMLTLDVDPLDLY